VVVRVGNLRLLRLSDTHREGACTFLDPEMRCRIHTHDGGRTKPRSCHRFPYLLARTPDGLRVGTDHRCPCRTLGERAPLDPDKAHAALTDTSGRLSVDRRIEGRMPIGPRRRVGWKRYVAMERALLEQLGACDASRPVEDVLCAEPFPALEIGSWEQLGVDLGQESRPSRWGEAFRLFGRTLAWMHSEREARPSRLQISPRLWGEAFDRAERRTPFVPERADDEVERMYADFVADFVWALEWPFWCDMTQLRVELVTRLAVARTFARALVLQGHRADRAAAEAIAMIEVVGVSPAWIGIASRL